MYTTLGRTDLNVSTIGLGGASIGGSYGPVLDEPEALRVIHTAIAEGINYIDTAPLYGLGASEERIGRALAKQREKVILATKVGYLPPGLGYDYTTTLAGVHASLKRLNTGCIDIIQIHEADRIHINRIMDMLTALRDLQDAGDVRFIGITGDNPDALAELAKLGIFDTVQNFRHYTPLNMQMLHVLNAAKQYHMGTINGSPLGMGLLAGMDQVLEMGRPVSEQIETRVRAFQQLATMYDMTLPELALRFSLSEPLLHVTIPGTKHLKHLATNLKAWRAGPLEYEVRNRIANLQGHYFG